MAQSPGLGLEKSVWAWLTACGIKDRLVGPRSSELSPHFTVS